MENFFNLSKDELKQFLLVQNISDKNINMRVNQLWRAVYVDGVTSFCGVTTLSKDLRKKCKSIFSIGRPNCIDKQISSDQTKKWLLDFGTKSDTKDTCHIKRSAHTSIETVFIPESFRGTLCISSQIGCPLRCSFCYTGTQTWLRNLTCDELVTQVMIAKDDLHDWPHSSSSSKRFNREISNIVFMGMGEPLLNFSNVKKAISILSDGEGLSFSKRRITLSTAGVVPMIHLVGQEIGCSLAISLHAVRDDIRDILVPINKKYPIKLLLEACRSFPGLSNARRITFEYIMLKDINDSEADAKQLVRLLRGIPSKVNLIPFNVWPGSTYECSPLKTIEKFSNIVRQGGYTAPIRVPRGSDILAACGQLKGSNFNTAQT